MNEADLYSIVKDLVDKRREGDYWDFKRDWHDDDTELLHDILCLCNNLESTTSYLIIGIDEENGYCAVDVTSQENRKSRQQLTDWLTHIRWFGHNWPHIDVQEIHFGGVMIDVLVIQTDIKAFPYCLEMPNSEIKPFRIYVRRGETNTPKNEFASWDEVESLWKRHFGLDLAPVDRLPELLADKDNWLFQSSISNSASKYYRFDPLYVVEDDFDYDRDGYEYYMLRQCDTTPHWGRLWVTYSGNQIYDCQTVILDGGRYTSVVPERSFFRWWCSNPLETDIVYCYFTKDSLDWSLHRFLYDAEGTSDEKIAHDRFMECLLVFEDDVERKDFERFLKSIREEFETRLAAVKEPIIQLPDDYAERGRESLKKQIRHMTVLKELLGEYREGRRYDNRVSKTSREW